MIMETWSWGRSLLRAEIKWNDKKIIILIEYDEYVEWENYEYDEWENYDEEIIMGEIIAESRNQVIFWKIMRNDNFDWMWW